MYNVSCYKWPSQPLSVCVSTSSLPPHRGSVDFNLSIYLWIEVDGDLWPSESVTNSYIVINFYCSGKIRRHNNYSVNTWILSNFYFLICLLEKFVNYYQMILPKKKLTEIFCLWNWMFFSGYSSDANTQHVDM